MTFEPRLAQETDLPSWLALAKEAEPLFGPMPDIGDFIERNMSRGTAIVAGPEGEVMGAMLMSRADKSHQINWLVVAPAARRHGIGSALVRYAIAAWPTGDIELTTFAADNLPGVPARRLYESLGFRCIGPAEPAHPKSDRNTPTSRLCDVEVVDPCRPFVVCPRRPSTRWHRIDTDEVNIGHRQAPRLPGRVPLRQPRLLPAVRMEPSPDALSRISGQLLENPLFENDRLTVDKFDAPFRPKVKEVREGRL